MVGGNSRYKPPRVEGLSRVTALLECWAAWRTGWLHDVFGKVWPQCTLGRLVHGTRQKGELWKHNEPRVTVIFSEEAMQDLSRVIASLPDRHKSVVMIEYSGLRRKPQAVKAKKAGITDRYYRQLLVESQAMIDERMPWRKHDISG